MTGIYDGKVVVVTGASTGLGRAIATGAAAQGAHALVINFVSRAGEAEITAGLVRDAGAQAILAQGDFAQDEDCRRIAAAAAPFGRIDALFNNAATSKINPYDNMDGLDADDFLRIYRVNVVGPYQMIRAARTLLEAADVGAVVNTSSIAGVTGGGSSLAYASSKAALNAMTKGLARALAPKIRVNAICPGFIDSPWFERMGYEQGRENLADMIRRTTPLRAASTPEDIADSALFLGSRASRHVTGETLLVDAGLHLGS